MTSFMNDINLKLQGKSKNVFDMYSLILGFFSKLKFLKEALDKNSPLHFKTLKNLKPSTSQLRSFSLQISNLTDQFLDRFKDCQDMESEMKIVFSPITADVQTAPADIQLELLELQSDVFLMINIEIINS